LSNTEKIQGGSPGDFNYKGWMTNQEFKKSKSVVEMLRRWLWKLSEKGSVMCCITGWTSAASYASHHVSQGRIHRLKTKSQQLQQLMILSTLKKFR
jgi:hypothetical protein